jgi:hypothetical protein
MKRYLLATGIAVAFATAAMAQSSSVTTTTTTGSSSGTEYYVVQDSATKRCTVVDQRPTESTRVVVGPGGFKSRTEAETGMRSIQVCSSN